MSRRNDEARVADGLGAAVMGNPSREMDYCQGTVPEYLSFERETRKWSGWKRLAGIWEFGETELEVSGG
jgi:hypothetical protein